MHTTPFGLLFFVFPSYAPKNHFEKQLFNKEKLDKFDINYEGLVATMKPEGK